MEVIITLRIDLEEDLLYYQIQKALNQNITQVRVNCAKYNSETKINNFINSIKKINNKFPELKIMLDLPYPRMKIRIDINSESFNVEKNGIYIVTASKNNVHSPFNILFVDQWIETDEWDKKVGDIIYYADGECSFLIKEINKSYIVVEALDTYTLENHKSISLGTIMTNELYLKNIEEGLRNIRIDGIALSFVENSDEVAKVKEFFQNYNLYYISKIESANALNNIKSILTKSDGIIIARGDLSLYTGISSIATNQKFLIDVAQNVGKKVYIATGIMTSLIKANIPTAADVVDIVTMIKTGVDGIILNNDLVYYDKTTIAMKIILDNLREIMYDEGKLEKYLD